VLVGGWKVKTIKRRSQSSALFRDKVVGFGFTVNAELDPV